MTKYREAVAHLIYKQTKNTQVTSSCSEEVCHYADDTIKTS